MKKKVYLDFWSQDSMLEGISKVYGIPEKEIIHLIVRYHEQEELLSAIFEQYQIHPDVHDLDNVYIRCKLIGKYPDKSMLKAEGLLSLTELLKREDAFLVRFLKENGININVEKRTFRLHDTVVKIKKSSDLGNKLYYDRGEIEAFYCCDENEMIKYSTVKRYPEILLAVDEFVEKNFRRDLDLGNKWSDLCAGFDIISFYVKLNDTTYINNCRANGWQETWPYENYYKEEYPYTDSYPELLYRNLWLLKYGLSRIHSENFSELCLGIRNGVAIPYSELSIEHCED